MARPSDGFLSLAAVLSLAALAACRVPFARSLLFSTERPQSPVAEDCQRCHGEVFEEWKHSPHAGAWSSSHFRSLTADYAAEGCLGCHAPGPLGERGEIALRADHRAEGVTCVSCHLSTAPGAGALTMRGPHARTTPVEVHPVAVDDLYEKAELCGTCHSDVLEQWRAAPAPADGGEKEVCQSCHMPAVRRTIESVDPARPYSRVLVALGREIDGRRHRFSVPDEPWKDVELRATREGDVWRVEVSNEIPHAIPTGAFGRREARIRAGDSSVRLTTRDGQAIPAGQTRSYELRAPAGAEPVLERRDPGSGAWGRLAPAPDGGAR
jgi:hypothetical protein